MIQARSIRWVITVLPFVPLILFVIPKAFVVMPEPGEFIPWYTKYTEVPWLLTAFYVYPTTWLTSLIGFRILGPVHVILMLAYAAGISLLLRGTMHTGVRQVFRRTG
jgi:hypothetical protein